MVIFKDGMKIDLTRDLGWKDYAYYLISVLLMIAFWLGIPLGITQHTGFFGLFGAIIIYAVYSSCTDTCKYLKNLVELPQTFDNINSAIQSIP